MNVEKVLDSVYEAQSVEENFKHWILLIFSREVIIILAYFSFHESLYIANGFEGHEQLALNARNFNARGARA